MRPVFINALSVPFCNDVRFLSFIDGEVAGSSSREERPVDEATGQMAEKKLAGFSVLALRCAFGVARRSVVWAWSVCIEKTDSGPSRARGLVLSLLSIGMLHTTLHNIVVVVVICPPVIFELPCAGFSFLASNCLLGFFLFSRPESIEWEEKGIPVRSLVVSRDRLFIRLHLSLLLSVSRCRPDQKKLQRGLSL